jgi:hypothetical protein
VRTLLNNELKAGNYKVSFDASGLASGVYYYTMKAGGFKETRKMIILK